MTGKKRAGEELPSIACRNIYVENEETLEEAPESEEEEDPELKVYSEEEDPLGVLSLMS